MGRKSNATKYNESVIRINEAARRMKKFRGDIERHIQFMEKAKQGKSDPLEVEIINQDITHARLAQQVSEASGIESILEQVKHQRDDLHMPELAEAWEALGTRVFIEDAIMPGLAEADQKPKSSSSK